MNYKLLFFVAILFLAACSNGEGEIQSSIDELEKKLEETNDPQVAESLVEQYKVYIKTHPEDMETNSRYLYRAGSIMFRMNRYSGATDYFSKAIRDYYPAETTPKASLFLGMLYDEQLRNPEAAITIFQGMLQAFPQFEELEKAKAKIPADTPPIAERLENMRVKMFNDSTQRIEYRIANDYINSCQLHAMVLPEDPQSPVLLHKAGEVARSIRAFNKALEIYNWIYTKYPNYEKAPQALFLQAFTLDNDLKKYDEAKVLYEEFLKKYPNDDFADDTKFLLENLGKDDEEIINSFSGEQEKEAGE
ncbi:MAG: hypothetical protein DHS20C18_16810 [Saprospiraceae bacterium]|nr:MAG: hypothetical protein DHS20C18_16810 [Saprospiraceae bacterium]